MARRSSASMFSRIIYGAIVLVFGLIALAVTYQAFTQGVNLRSKAAQTDVIYKGWEFNGKTVDGWVGNPHSTSVANGSLRMVIRKTKSVPDILQKNANTSLPQGNKYLKLLISVGGDGKRSAVPGNIVVSQGEIVKDPEFVRSVQSNVVCTQEVNQCPDGSYVGRIGPSCVFAPCPSVPKPGIGQPVSPLYTVRAAVYYKLTSSKRWEKPLEFYVVADGRYREYLARFPEIAPTTVERVRIAFPSGLRVGHVVLIDWIRLVGTIPPPPPPTGTPYTCGGFTGALCPSGYQCDMPYPASGGTCVPIVSRTPTPYTSPTPPPTYYPSPTPIVCKTGVSNFFVDTPCDGGYRRMNYSCYDGYRGSEGLPDTCKSSDEWSYYAKQYCAGHSSCTISNTPTPTPSQCYNAQPQIDVVPQVQNGKPLQALTYVVNITNLDVASCGTTRFNLSADVPSDWTAKFAYPYVDLSPGQKISLALYVTSSMRDFKGEQSVGVRVFSTKYGQSSLETVIYNVTP